MGLKNVRLFVVKPDRHMPIDIYSFHRPSLNQMLKKYDGKNSVKRVIGWLSDGLRVPYMLAYFEPAFYFVAEK